MNTMYNFYSEGVLKKFVLRLEAPTFTTAEQMRIRFYVAIATAIVAYGYIDSRKKPE